MPLPKDFMQEFTPVIKNVVILEHNLDQLTKKELQATVAFLISDLEEKRLQIANFKYIQPPSLWARDN